MHTPFLTGKKLYLFLHIAAWSILFILPTYFLYMDSSHDVIFLARTYLHTVFLAFIFYINYLWLAPKFFFKEKKVHYFVSVMLLIAFITLLFAFTNNQLNPKPEWGKEMNIQMQMQQELSINKPPDMPPSPDTRKHKPPKGWPVYNFVLNSLLITGFGLGLRFSEKMIQTDKRRKEAEKEKLNSELALLKNQISPHFFFNTLNNIYSLVQTNTDDAQKAILQLSKLMRYLIYESEEGTTPLGKEIEFMNHYIDLMQLRINNKVELKVDFPEVLEPIPVHPLLFIPFIENAFKHGISYREPSFIHIKMQINNGILWFTCENSINTQSESLVSSGSGIGLENIKKRLALLYPGKYTLDISHTDRQYNVSLKIITT